MTSIDAVLQPNEHVVTKARQNLGAVVVPVILLLVGAPIFFLNLGTALDGLRLPALLLVVIGAWGTVSSLSRRFTTQFTLTDERVLGKHGLLHQQTMDSALNKIDRVQVDRSFLGRVLGYGTLILTISGAGRGREQFQQISAPERVAQQIREQASIRSKTLH